MNNDKLKAELCCKESKVLFECLILQVRVTGAAKKIVVVWIKKSGKNNPFSVFL